MRNFGIGFAVAAAIFAVIGVAYAAIPHSGTGVISGCVGYITGSVRVIDEESGQSCRPWERDVDWNQTGPTGPEGPQGDQGVPGLDGTDGTDGADGTDGDDGDDGADGAPGPAGPAASTTYYVATGGSAGQDVTVDCDAGDIATGVGGYETNHPIRVQVRTAGTVPVGFNFILAAGESGITGRVICLDLTP